LRSIRSFSITSRPRFRRISAAGNHRDFPRIFHVLSLKSPIGVETKTPFTSSQQNAPQPSSMGPSLRDHVRPSTRDNRPATRDQVDSSLIIPSRTSSLHSRITQPIPATLNMKPTQRAPKTLTHAYMVCGVGREPSQWVRAPQPAQGKIQHMKGAVGQFWLPEILGSSPRMDQDNEMAKSLHAAMRVRTH
jgi:hypothetical protein